MKKMKKIFFGIFSVIIILVVLVFSLRIYNDHKYKDINALNFPEYYKDAVSYTHLTLPTIHVECRSRWSPYH